MKVVDTSIWIDFWRGRASAGGLADLLRDGQVLASTKLAGAELWTGDRRLQQAWERLGSHG